jgi:hypothetical protein
VVSALFLAACDILGPKGEHTDVYDVTTTLDKFSFETASPSPPDCPFSPTMSLYCTHVRPFAGATLTGVMSIRGSGDTLIASGEFSGKMCSQIDYTGLTGCTAVSDRTDTYGPYSTSMIHAEAVPPTIAIRMRVGSGLDYKPILGFNGTMRGDSISGDVFWSAAPGRSPPTHWGHFVARRRR